MIRELCTRNVHETPDFTPISGDFRAFLQMVTCTTKKGSVENQWGLYFPFLYPPNNTLIPLVIDRCNEIYILYFAFVDVY